MTHPPYAVPERRELTLEERSLLKFLLDREAPERVQEIESLKVVARCGCGKCPTVLFGETLGAEPRTGMPARELASYRGVNGEGIAVGVVLIERQGRVSELEAWSPHGADVHSWPTASALEAERAS